MEEEIELIVGTYEDYIVGYEHHKSSLNHRFALRAHSGSVRCIVCSPNGVLILSAGHDDMLNILNMKKRKLMCSFEGSINCATFVGNSHVVCGSEDGNIYIYECKKDVVLAKTLKGHKGPVVSLTAHPSSKLLLSVSKDGTMRTWNLIKGRSAFVTRLKNESHIVKWSRSGNEFIIASDKELNLYNNKGKHEQTVKLEKRINQIEFQNDHTVIIATDSGIIDFYNLKENHLSPSRKFTAHESRVKSIKCLGTGSKSRLATASSDGKLKLWTLPDKSLSQPKLLSEVNTGARLTCMSARINKRSSERVPIVENST